MQHLPIDEFNGISTPFYYYDIQLLRETLNTIKKETEGSPFVIHYAIKANGNSMILKEIKKAGLGADLVSGGEIRASLASGLKPEKMTFSGVGKTDWEIELGLDNDIYCFNVESVPELVRINEIAAEMGKTAGVAIRVNPDIDAHTHRYITTGTADNKFGICLEFLPQVVQMAIEMPNIHLRGLHFHIGSQITTMKPFEMLCEKVNELQDQYEKLGIKFEMINMGGGLGIDYDDPDGHPITDFASYFNVFKNNLKIRKGQTIHFELGRSIVAQCGSLIAKVVFVKESRDKKFVILDAGMTDLIRPALYEAHHKIMNLTSQATETDVYDVVGPVCESSDVFAQSQTLPITQRGDLIALRSAGAYGESMASTYNMRRLPECHFSE